MLFRSDIAERLEFHNIGLPSTDARNIRAFASTTDRQYFDRNIRPERRVNKSAIRMLEENREFLEDRMLPGRRGTTLDSQWIDDTIEKLNNGEISHTDAMNIMDAVVAVVSDRIRKDPSLRDATDGDVYHYQKLGKRLRRAMTAGVEEEDMRTLTEESLRPRGFASTTTRTSSTVDRFSPEIISGRVIVPEGVSEEKETWRDFEHHEQLQAVTYEINGERVAFGIQDRHGIDTTGVRVMEMNPFEITGTSRDDASADDLARNWVYAHVGFGEENTTTNGTEVSALFYAASKGDSDAQKEIDRLAKSGKEAVEEAKKERLGSIDKRNDGDREFQEKKARLEEIGRAHV